MISSVLSVVSTLALALLWVVMIWFFRLVAALERLGKRGH